MVESSLMREVAQGDTEETREERRLRCEQERALIRASQAGDLDAFGELVQRYQKKVYWIAYSLVGHADDAQDLSQEAFLRVFKAIERFKLQYNFYTWLYRIVVNLSIDYLRKRGKQAVISVDEFPTEPATFDGPERDMENSELRHRIAAVLHSLPPKYKTVIVLRDIHGMPCEEISRIIHCTNATTRWRLHKARDLFKQRWERTSRATSRHQV
jgi:RNA polymerase sigma-70 factor (ECF subfamily)